MGNFEFLMLVIGGLWLYSRCGWLVLAQRYEDCMESVELVYSDRSDSGDSQPGGNA